MAIMFLLVVGVLYIVNIIGPEGAGGFSNYIFTDPESGEKLTAGRAETLKDDYARAYAARRETLADNLRHLGWSFITHRTDRLASEALVAVHAYLSGMPAMKAEGIAVLLSEQNLYFASAVSDRAYVIEKGVIRPPNPDAHDPDCPPGSPSG